MRQFARVTAVLALLVCGLALLPQITALAGPARPHHVAGANDDVLLVTRAEWRASDHELNVRATTTAGGNAVLSVYETSTGLLIGVMTHQDGNEHEGQFSWPHNPLVITVRSSQGGEATVLVSGDAPPTTTSAAPTPTGVAATATMVAPTSTSVAPTATDDATSTATATATRAVPTATSGPVLRRVYLPRNLK
jgi:hypothetical protein